MFKRISCAFFLLIVTLFIGSKAFSQANNTFFQMPQIVPSSPEASALYKVSDVPMDYSSGAANIDIPIYTVKDGNITVPISITYNTSGIKVQDVAGLIGLGWNLNFGGIITVRGEAYQGAQTVLRAAFKQQNDISISDPNSSLAETFCYNVVNGQQEKQNPQYYYHFGNYSGSFFYDINGHLSINSNDQRLAITELGNPSLGIITGFIITTPEGLQYTFADQETASSTWGSRPSAFNLSKIVDLNTTRSVVFKYKPTVAIYSPAHESQFMSYYLTNSGFPPCAIPEFSVESTTSTTGVSALQIDSIKFSSGFVKFFSSNDRLDLFSTRINQINVVNNSNTVIKNIVFNQSYFVSSNAAGIPANYNNRLKLDSIAFKTPNNTTVERYGFSYNTNVVLPPYRFSDGTNYHDCTAVDYWGYFNGRTDNLGLIPKDQIDPADFQNYDVPTGLLGDRKADSVNSYAQACILNQITYPTGGVTQLLYENNYVNGYVLGNTVGGVRIKQINYYDNTVSGVAHSKCFKYFNGAIPVVFPNKMYSYDKSKILSCSTPSGVQGAGQAVSRSIYSDPIGTVAYLIINPFYSHVEEYDMDGALQSGKTVYYYDTASQYWLQPVWFPEYGNLYVTDRNWLKSQLLKRTEYYKIDPFNNYQIVKKEENSYTDNEEANPLMGLHVVIATGYDYVGPASYCYYYICPPTVEYGALLVQYQGFNAKGDHGSRILSSKRIVDYTATDSLVTITNFSYTPNNNNYSNTNNDYYYLSSESTINSKGDNLMTTFKYPISGKLSFANLDPQAGIAIDTMTARNIIAPVLETDYFKNTVFVNGTRTNYALWPGNNGTLILPKTLQTQQGTNAYENRLDFINYDSYGNPLTLSKDKGAAISYIWGYNQNYPVSQINNSTTNDVFYDSFEEGNGNSVLNDSKTGHYSHTGLYSKVLAGLDNGSYTLSYWLKSNGVWILQTSTITVSNGSYPISLNNQIDDVCFYPAKAQMSTSTFDPLIGITSSTDVKGETNYYQYDSFNRLMNIRDYNGNILKNLQYNYTPALSPSVYTNVAASRAFVKNNCATGYYGSIINYIVPARTYYATSQVAADALAQNDINTNGQNYANATGGCIINNPVITSMTLTGQGTATLAFNPSIPNCTSVLITYTNITNGPGGASGTITGTAASPIAVTVPTSPATFSFTITCYSANYPLGLTSAPFNFHFPF